MTRAQSTNLILIGIIIGMVVSQACGGAGGAANAADDCTCTVDGPIEVTIDASTTNPVPVMICDGLETNGLCARVYEYQGTHELDVN